MRFASSVTIIAMLFLLRDGRMGWSMGAIAHVGGSLLMTLLGLASVSLAFRSI